MTAIISSWSATRSDGAALTRRLALADFDA
jgi:hypothetical protein